MANSHASPPAPQENSTFNLAYVLAQEAEEIRRRFPDQKPGETPDRFGLCFSGGGIRSACVALGVTQSLARHRLFGRVHYISAISGGGYFLGCLSAWIKRAVRGFAEVDEQLAGFGKPSPQAGSYERFLEPDVIRHLRRYSSYLTPRLGLLGGDSLAMASIYLRNLLLNLTMVVSGLFAMTLVMQLFAPQRLWRYPLPGCVVVDLFVLIAACFVCAVRLVATQVEVVSSNTNSGSAEQSKWAIRVGFFGCLLLWFVTPSFYAYCGATKVMELLAALLATIGFIITGFFHKTSEVKPVAKVTRTVLAIAWTAAALLVAGIALLFFQRIYNGVGIVVSGGYVVTGLPAILASFPIVSYLFIGILGDQLPDAEREWLARFAGYFISAALVSLIVMAIALEGSAWMQWLFDRIVKWGWKGLAATLLPGGWAYVSLTGLIKGRSGDTSGKEAGYSYSGFVVAVAPPVFLAGLLLVVSWGADSLASRLEAVVSTSQISQTSELYPQRHSQTIDVILTRPKIPDNKVSNAPTTARNTGQLGKSLRYADLIAAFVSLAVILALRLDANEFSMHLFYRNRLVRAFVGASNVDRKPNVFTGFARNDDLSLRNLVHVAPSPTYAGDTFGKPYDGPYPLWGTTLNITRGEDLSLQQRKGTSFIYSPLFCGWDYVPGDLPNTPPFLLETPSSSPNDFGYRKTSVYSGEGGRPFLGTAMAASGAAVSPNMGYHTRPGVAALLALFNVRLGWWTGNPRSPKGWCKYAPGAGYLLKELFSSVTADDTYVYLSDGGHFENLGLYELVRRRVPFIIAVDADADADYGFDNLGNAVEHCRRDFGVEIQIQAAKDMAKGKHTGQRKRHYALGRIVYPPGPEPQTGVLLYIKSSLTGDEPADVLAMVNDYKNFPNDSTANQFFNESLFESYRALGEHMMDTVFDDAQSKAKDNTPKLEEKWDVDFAKGEPGDLAKWFYGRLDARVPPSTPSTHV